MVIKAEPCQQINLETDRAKQGIVASLKEIKSGSLLKKVMTKDLAFKKTFFLSTQNARVSVAQSKRGTVFHKAQTLEIPSVEAKNQDRFKAIQARQGF